MDSSLALLSITVFLCGSRLAASTSTIFLRDVRLLLDGSRNGAARQRCQKLALGVDIVLVCCLYFVNSVVLDLKNMGWC